MKKMLFLLSITTLIVVCFALPASAMCDECVNSEDQITEDHCVAHCTCYYEECSGCGENTNLVYCDNEHDVEEYTVQPDCENAGKIVTVCLECDTVLNEETVGKPMGHKWEADSSSATCEKAGTTYYTCKRCGETHADVTNALGHDFGNPTTVTPTCTAAGYTYQTCSRCKAIQIDPNSYIQGFHTPKEVSRTEPLCTKDGVITYKCKDCNVSLPSGVIEAPGHKYVEGFCSECGARDPDYVFVCDHNYTHTVTPPTCYGQGYTTHKCSKCGDSYVDSYKNPVAHSFENGYCTVCGDLDPNYVAPCEHSFTSVVTAPTCTSQGFTTHTCSKCTESYTDSYKSKIDHNYESSVTAPTCTAQGFTTHTCDMCDDSYVDTYTNKIPHSYQDGACTECGAGDPDYVAPCDHNYSPSVTPPSCTSQGYTTYTCSKCGDSYQDSFKDVIAHSFKDGNCGVCGAPDPDYVPPCAHEYSWTVVPPICTAHGYTTYACTKCEYTYTADFTYTNEHVYENGKCTNCGRSAEPSGCVHDYSSIITAPTCFEKGFTTFTCKKCNDSYVDLYTDQIPHTFVLQNEVKPKCGIAGERYYTCNNPGCTEEKYETIEALAHDWKTVSSHVSSNNNTLVTSKCTRCLLQKTEEIPTQAGQAQNWLLTSIRGFADAFIDIYQTVANGFQIGGITLGQVISGALIVAVLLLLLAFALKIVG